MPCPKCAQLLRDIQKLQTRLQQLEQEQRDSQQRIRELQEQLAEARKDSSTSAKPPSSDIVKPPKPPLSPDAPKRSIGGQPGHPPHFRAPFPPEQLTATRVHRLTHCPECGQLLESTQEQPRIVQQIDLQALTYTIEEHQSHTGWCPHCHKASAAPFPGPVAKGGLLGPQLTALVA